MSASPRLYVGFLDDQAFRWEPERIANFDRARREGATVVRSIVNWSVAAPQRPRHPADPFAPEYRLSDVDELVRNAERRGIEVLLTIWGTPRWANGGARPNVAPTDPSDLRDFAHALAARYSGRHPGYPFVRFYTVWNEPNAEQFLSPQFDPRGRPVAPRVVRRRSSRRPTPGSRARARRRSSAPARRRRAGATGRARRAQDTESPARFARLVAAAAPDLRFDAWAHHPYPRNDLTHPDAPQRWPAVGFTSLGRFDASLARWFGRASVPLWVTEIAYRTSPEIRGAAPYSLQAVYLARALALARAQPGVTMLVWFVFRDEPGRAVAERPRRPARPREAVARDVRRRLGCRPRASSQVAADPASFVHAFRVPALELRSHLAPGARLGVRYTLAACGPHVAGGMTDARMGADGWVPVTRASSWCRGRRYRLALRIEDAHGQQVRRELAVSAAGAKPAPAHRCAADACPDHGATRRRHHHVPRSPRASAPGTLESALVPADYVRAVERAGGRPLLVPPSTDGIDETLDAVDGLVFSGGSDIDPELYGHERAPRDEGRRPRAATTRSSRCSQAALARDMPVLAICRGSQLLNVAHGGDLVQHLPGGRRARRAQGDTGRLLRPRGHDRGRARRSATLVGERSPVKSHHHQGFGRARRRPSRRRPRRGRLARGARGAGAALRARRALASRGRRGRAALRGARRQAARYRAERSA